MDGDASCEDEDDEEDDAASDVCEVRSAFELEPDGKSWSSQFGGGRRREIGVERMISSSNLACKLAERIVVYSMSN